MSGDCNLCTEVGKVYHHGVKILEAKYPRAQIHKLWLPNKHISQSEMLSTHLYMGLVTDLISYGQHHFKDGYRMIMNTGKFLEVPEHAHIQLLTHEGKHDLKSCKVCEKYYSFYKIG